MPYPSATKVMAELARVTKTGGKIGLLHEFIPPTGGKMYLPVKLLGIIGIMNGPQKRIRLFAIYRKTEQQTEIVYD